MVNEIQGWRLPKSVEQALAPILRTSQRRMIIFCSCLAAVGLALLIMTRTTPSPQAVTHTSVEPMAGTRNLDADRLARELAGILAQIAGAGRVEVRLTLINSTASQWERNRRYNQQTVEDRGQDGGVRVTREETEETTLALARRADGSEAPIEILTAAAQVAGAIVVADGAKVPRIKAELARATAAFLGIGLHRIAVFAREADR